MGLLLKEEKEIKRQRLLKEKEDQMMKECSFRPKL